jgi:hypothetical protein
MIGSYIVKREVTYIRLFFPVTPGDETVLCGFCTLTELFPKTGSL